MDADEVIDSLWTDAATQIMAINPATENWKAQVLPLARIKKIMKSEEAICTELDSAASSSNPNTTTTPDQQSPPTGTGQRFMIAGEAPVLLEKACELLVRELTVRAWRHTERCRRRTLQRQDVHAAVGENEVYDFLIDIVPRVTSSLGSGAGGGMSSSGVTTGGGLSAGVAAAAAAAGGKGYLSRVAASVGDPGGMTT
eukprot:CAMPEP_0172490464 /NCGR_PEP_ID=MMETSP1066-20121228/20889_1 /TAXON_ID=671091 /ORGANISM="Coscinodiscus wailesii, Strain CCMP2513" /LENGTH=197 /DNA_ID=CAMNT_0013258935 /DNA_START=298 /DNA_END=888 /DNA_ORIENTATION=+